MKVYIAYKFSNVEDKKKLQVDINNIAKRIEKNGNETFILSRDLQKWKNFSHSIPHKMLVAIRELWNTEHVVAYINSTVFSKGLMFELFFAKLFMKNITLIKRGYIKAPLVGKLATTTIVYSNFSELDIKLNK